MKQKENDRMNMYTGLQLYYFRTELGLTQEDLSKKSGVSQKEISSIEAGKGCSLNTFKKLALAMGLKVSAPKFAPIKKLKI